VKVKTELNSSNKVTNINGCSIFLQVLYLDSIDVGSLNISHDTFPRIRHFTAEIMKTMIMADTIPGKLEAGGFEFGKSQFREKKYSLLLLGNKLATPIRNTFIINNCWIVGTGFIISTDTWSPSSGCRATVLCSE